LLPFTEDLKELLEGVGFTHLVSVGFLKEYPLIQNVIEVDLDPQSSFILTPNIFFPISGEKEPDLVNYALIPMTEIGMGYPIDCQQLQKMYNPDGKVRFYVFFNEHYAPYLTRGLQYVKTKNKFTER